MTIGVHLPADPRHRCRRHVTTRLWGGRRGRRRRHPSILGPSALVSGLRAWWNSTGRGQPPPSHRHRGPHRALRHRRRRRRSPRRRASPKRCWRRPLHQQRHRHQQLRRNRPLRRHRVRVRVRRSDHRRARADPAAEEVRTQATTLRLANPNVVAPRAGASATTWGGLAGTWASATTCGPPLSSVYESMLTHAGSTPDPADLHVTRSTDARGSGDLAVSGDWRSTGRTALVRREPRWFTKPHHDYPAADIPMPVGTPPTPSPTRRRRDADEAGSAGSGSSSTATTEPSTPTATATPAPVAIGDRVNVGQRLIDSASTGNSTGPPPPTSASASTAPNVARSRSSSRSPTVNPSHRRGLPTSGCSY